MIDVLLVHPMLHKEKKAVLAENLGLGYIAALLRENGFITEILDGYVQQWNSYQLVQEIIKRSPSIIGICVLSQSLAEIVLEIVAELRKENCQAHICLGHHFPSLAHKDLLSQIPLIDSIIRGEGEYAMLELVNALASNHSLTNIAGLTFRNGNSIHVNQDRRRIGDIDALPYPARDTLPIVLHNTQSIQILGSRGCYHHCSFCSITHFFNKTGRILRSPESVTDEMERVIRNYRCGFFRFSDDNFVDRGSQYKTWIFNLCEQIEKRKLKISFRVNCRADCIEAKTFSRLRSVGLWEVAVGVETGCQATLDRYNKKTTVQENLQGIRILEQLGIRHKIGYILFDPFATIEQTYNSLLYLKGYRSNSLKGFYHKAEPFTGTSFRKQMIQQGLLSPSSVWDLEPYIFQDHRLNQLYSFIEPLRQSMRRVNTYIHLFKNTYLWSLENLELLELEKIDRTVISLIVEKIDAFISQVENYYQQALKESILVIKNKKINYLQIWHGLKNEWCSYEKQFTREAEEIIKLVKNAVTPSKQSEY